MKLMKIICTVHRFLVRNVPVCWSYLNIFSSLFQELKGFGITESVISNHMARYPALKTNGRL